MTSSTTTTESDGVGDDRISATLTVSDPWDGSVVKRVSTLAPADAAPVVARSRAAAAGWGTTPAGARCAALKVAARALREQVDELALLQSRETGKPIGDSTGGVEAGIGSLESYAEQGPLHRGRSLQGDPDAADLMLFEPRGVCVVLTPWNDPVAVTLQGVAAALAVGDTVVVKPSERAPLAAARAAQVLADALPDDVLQVVHGDGAVGAALVAQEGVDVVYHVGSSATGRSIRQACAATGAHVVLENGGNDPCLVDAGVDPVWAAEQVALGAFANAGQICVAVERVYVHREIVEPFLAALVEQARVRCTGDPRDPATTLGPLVDTRMREQVHAQVTDAVDRGARLLTGGEIPTGPGSGYPATVLTDCTPQMLVMTEETFGPVAPVTVVDDLETAFRLAADSGYGLAATVLTADLATALRAARELPVGTVKVNAVFGGAPGGAAEPRRGSGTGLGYGPELLDELAQYKVVHWQAPPA